MRPRCPVEPACMQVGHLHANGALGNGAIFDGNPTAAPPLSSAQIELGTQAAGGGGSRNHLSSHHLPSPASQPRQPYFLPDQPAGPNPHHSSSSPPPPPHSSSGGLCGQQVSFFPWCGEFWWAGHGCEGFAQLKTLFLPSNGKAGTRERAAHLGYGQLVPVLGT